MEYTNYNFGHDEFDNSAQRLREWKWAQIPETYWRMPVAFGPMPGPRQTHYGIERSGAESTFTTASIKIKTSRTVLQNLFPPGKTSWRFKSPGTVAYCSFSQTTLGKMQWLGGSGYSHIGLYIHGVEHVKQDGETVSGTYLPLLFESLTDPIVSGREELGMPKLYSSIDIERDSTSYHIRAGWQGMTWGSFQLNNLTPVESSAAGRPGIKGSMTGDDSDAGILVHRYIPKVGREKKGQSEADYAVFDRFAEAKPQATVQRAWASKSAKFEINARDWKALPTLHHIIQRLQEIPVYEIVAGRLVEGVGVSDVAAAKRIE
jgi:Acetoacetate decarboxylase (ADC)